ncbi:uncharacterized protein LOC127001878 isoform X3 [Eriocheir sinensis]|uniref:uncharacterized protein LOC127001878 isoform X3 n=1 Tax=Eriocheir sinensis TaxID=95602 RepID=UPI0021C8E1E2|nr:uncharacterized protein LOC127001878 isoform X3 [Eriocheir sinensis]
MTRASFVFAACLALSVCPCVQATWSWLSRQYLAEVVPEICGLKVILGSHTYNTSVLSGLPRDVEDIRFELPEAPPRGHRHTTESGTSHGSASPGSSCQWLARVGDTGAGAAISSRHVLTLASCIIPYLRWFGHYSFPVQVCDQVFEVERIEMQSRQGYAHSPVLLTLTGDINATVGASACAGAYHAGLVARAMTWHDEAGVPLEHIVTVYPRWQCSLYERGVRNFRLCAPPGPMMCGSPLVQMVDGGWSVVGLGTGDASEISTYIQVGQARDWLLRYYYE